MCPAVNRSPMQIALVRPQPAEQKTYNAGVAQRQSTRFPTSVSRFRNSLSAPISCNRLLIWTRNTVFQTAQCGFEPRRLLQKNTRYRQILMSAKMPCSEAMPTSYWECSSGVEQWSPKPRAEGSNPSSLAKLSTKILTRY